MGHWGQGRGGGGVRHAGQEDVGGAVIVGGQVESEVPLETVAKD